MRKLFSIFAALTLSTGLWAQNVGDQFEDATSGLKFKVTAVGEANTVKVAYTNYSGTTYNVPASVKYNDIDFAVTEIGDQAFQECTNLQKITLPESVTTIGSQAFQDCSNLQKISLPASVTTIVSYAFKGCTNLQEIAIPANVTTIGKSAFAGCSALRNVVFLGNACQDAIGDNAFDGVGKNRHAFLQLPDNWTGSKPEDPRKPWYGGYFQLEADPSALPTLKNADKAPVRKYIKDGRFEMEINGKKYNALGTEL